MESTLAQLIKMVSETAPEVWRLARQQVVVQTVTGLMAYVFFTIVFGGAVKWGIDWWKKPLGDGEYKCDKEFGQIGVGIGLAVGMMAWVFATAVGLFGYIVPRLLNPDWYAIEVLRSLLP